MHSSPSDTEDLKLFAKYGKDRIFETDLFDKFVSRLVRKHIMLQLEVQQGHPLLEEETRLFQESVSAVQIYLTASHIKWPIPWSRAKTVVIHYIRNIAATYVKNFELDDDVEVVVLESIHQENFDSLFPATWQDS